ncbi:amino-acid permease BAT1-like [Carya illinoinensis]|uniref:amino-acid permease BAT1-like n=1 Tax=Carya illinoinensis TaxID=32201 RepID=UPI001C71F2BA|nr:amino-acid permease BAT1-like [Carya illinoinensis]
MEGSIRISEDGGSAYHPLPDSDSIVSDDVRLQQLGYKRELTRGLSAIANFSVTFSIISVLTGLTTTYSTGLTYGGTVTMVYGWPIVGMLTMVVGTSMAEICSAFPTSGGLYFWSAKLCGNDWGPFASWLTGWSPNPRPSGPTTTIWFKINHVSGFYRPQRGLFRISTTTFYSGHGWKLR